MWDLAWLNTLNFADSAYCCVIAATSLRVPEALRIYNRNYEFATPVDLRPFDPSKIHSGPVTWGRRPDVQYFSAIYSLIATDVKTGSHCL
jgi:hypothetical protein